MQATIKAIPLTFYSRAFYWDLLRRGKGIGMGFIITLALIDLLYMGIVLFKPACKAVVLLPEMAASLPVATFKNHKLSIDAPTPYMVKWPDSTPSEPESVKPGTAAPNTNVIIDTSYVVDNLDALNKKMEDEKIMMLVTADQMITYKGKGHELRIQPLTTMPDMVITRDAWLKIAHKITIWAPVFFILFFGIGSFLINFIKIALGAVFAMLVNFFGKSMTDFGGAMRLSAATALPPSILFVVLPTHPFLKLLLWLSYMIFGAWCARKMAIPNETA